MGKNKGAKIRIWVRNTMCKECMSTWHRLPKIRGLVYFSSIDPMFKCWLWWEPVLLWGFIWSAVYSPTPADGSKSISRTACLSLHVGRKWDAIPWAWNQLSCYFPPLLCLMLFFLSLYITLYEPTAQSMTVFIDHRKDVNRIVPSSTILPFGWQVR